MTVNRNESGAAIGDVKLLKMSDLPDPVQGGYDKEKFAAILRAMKGSRSVRQFSIDADISESYMSKALNTHIDCSPSKRTLLKLLGAKAESPISRIELIKSAGYPDLGLDENALADAVEAMLPMSPAAAVNRYYGDNMYAAGAELMQALARHCVEGDMTSFFYREGGYFEVVDVRTKQVYVGINAYCRNERDRESASFALAFLVALTYNQVVSLDSAKEKIICILTDDEGIYDGCRKVMPGNKSKATVVLYTDDHLEFKREAVLKGSGRKTISLLN